MLLVDFGQEPELEDVMTKVAGHLPEDDIKALCDCYGFYYRQNPKQLKVESSGSTGNPKSFEFNYQAVITSIENTARALNLNEGITAFLALPLRYVAGRLMVLRAMHLKWKLYWARPSLKLSEIPIVEFAICTPAQLSANPEMLDRIKALLVGGASVSHHLERLVAERAKFSVFQSFAATETLTNFALRRLAPDYQEYYTALPSVKIKSDQSGKLWVYYPGITRDFITTGDLVELLSDTSFKWIGRSDFVINTGGLKVYPEKLEALLAESLGDRPFLITLVPDELLGQKIVLAIEAAAEKAIEKISQTFAQLVSEKKLPKQIIPKKVVFLKHFPTTKTGKPDRKKIQELVSTGHNKFIDL
ncbi:MAG: hypothetical protein ACK4KT_01900 [Thermaurantimonas sp.]